MNVEAYVGMVLQPLDILVQRRKVRRFVVIVPRGKDDFHILLESLLLLILGVIAYFSD